jgi:hypothetical protein
LAEISGSEAASGEHATAEGAKRSCPSADKRPAVERAHEEGSEQETDTDEEEGGSVLKGSVDEGERGSPDEGDGCQR